MQYSNLMLTQVLKIATKTVFKAKITASQSHTHSDLVAAPIWLLSSKWKLQLPPVSPAELMLLQQPATEPAAAVCTWDEMVRLKVRINGPALSPDLLLLPQAMGMWVTCILAAHASLLINHRQCMRTLLYEILTTFYFFFIIIL